MKIFAIIAILAISISSVSACGSAIVDQPFPYTSLESFGMDSWKNAITPTSVKTYTYDYSQCVAPEARGGSYVPDQKFPSVSLSEFNMDSWKNAK